MTPEGVSSNWSAHSWIVGITIDFAWDDARAACRTPVPGASSHYKNQGGSVAMSGVSRRHFLGLTGSAAVAAISGRASAAR